MGLFGKKKVSVSKWIAHVADIVLTKGDLGFLDDEALEGKYDASKIMREQIYLELAGAQWLMRMCFSDEDAHAIMEGVNDIVSTKLAGKDEEDEGDSEIVRIAKEMEGRISDYNTLMQDAKSHEKGSMIGLGRKFADLCGSDDDLGFAKLGAASFSGIVANLSKTLGEITITN